MYRSNRYYLVCLLAIWILLFSQSIALQHHHDGDLKLRYDCQVCLKLGSGQNGVPTAITDINVVPQLPFLHVELEEGLKRIVPLLSARAPPHGSFV